jgi:excisionase family DNA binding protein
MPMTEQILTLSQVAKYLKVHKSTIYRLVHRKELPAFKVSYHWRFDRQSIDQWRLAQEQRAKLARRSSRTWKHGAAILNATTSSDLEQCLNAGGDALRHMPLVNLNE